MLAWYLKKELAKFGARYDYDTTYVRQLVDLDTAGGLKLSLVSLFTSHRFGLPTEPYCAAGIIAVRAADCGSCLRLAIRKAEEAGVSRENIRALLAEAGGEVPPDMALAARYARAVLDNRPELPEIIAECEARWGRNGVAGLAAAVVSGIFYPTLKRGLGHGNACEPVLAWLRAETDREGQRDMTHA